MIPTQTDSNLNLTILAVYGTLMPGAGGLLEPLLAALPCRVEWLGACSIPGALYALDGYPGLKTDEAGTTAGMLCRISGDHQAAFAELDAYENFNPEQPQDGEYQRVALPLLTPRITAWVYHYRGSVAERLKIASGDWKHYLSLNRISI